MHLGPLCEVYTHAPCYVRAGLATAPQIHRVDHPWPSRLCSSRSRWGRVQSQLVCTYGHFQFLCHCRRTHFTDMTAEESAVNAAEDSLNALFSISYAHTNGPKRTIDSFPRLAALTRVAGKYGMHHALDYVSTQLVLPRIVAASTVGPFAVTHS